jgi:hypothetical protein
VRLDIVGPVAEPTQPTPGDSAGPHIGEGPPIGDRGIFPTVVPPSIFVTGPLRLPSMGPNETVNCHLSNVHQDLLIRVMWTDGRGEHAEDRVVLKPGSKRRN